MNIGELSQHPDFGRLIREVENLLDKATESVVAASSNMTLDAVRYRAGYMACAKELHDMLLDSKRKADHDG